ncbi:MAG: RNA ligase family protein, partial [Clostridia bacterium]|nr:RNA ligase family protein [Clostridia bacterium]
FMGRHVVIEEKIDGANTAVSFDGEGNLLLQSRGHYLTGGYREKHYNLFKQWAGIHRDAFWEVLGSRYIMYGEWMYAKHTIFYDALPHYFMEFDIYDRERCVFLSTPERRKMTEQMGIVFSVPVLGTGIYKTKKSVLDHIGPSNYITDAHIANLRAVAERHGLDVERQVRETDPTNTMEGLYIKVEEDGVVKERYKFVRAAFLQRVLESNSHWQSRPILPNLLKDGGVV